MQDWHLSGICDMRVRGRAEKISNNLFVCFYKKFPHRERHLIKGYRQRSLSLILALKAASQNCRATEKLASNIWQADWCQGHPVPERFCDSVWSCFITWRELGVTHCTHRDAFLRHPRTVIFFSKSTPNCLKLSNFSLFFSSFSSRSWVLKFQLNKLTE